MNIYLIYTAYEGCSEIAFSSVELAEQYIIDRDLWESDIVEVELDKGFSKTVHSARIAELYAQHKEEQIKFWEDIRANSVCEICGVKGWKACDCNDEVSCGSFGGVTKKGTACLNPVLKREEKRCYLHA